MFLDLLNNVYGKLNISQEEFAKKCTKLGYKVRREKINRILMGHTRPEEDLLRIMAKVCNADEKELVLTEYIEHSPKELIDFFEKFQELLFAFSKNIMEKDISKKEEELYDNYKKETIVKFILELLKMENTIITNSDCSITINSDNKLIVNMDKPFYIMEDNSMESKIPKDSKLKIVSPDKYKNGDIVLAEYNKTKYVRIAIFIGKNIFLYPLNRNYQSFYLNDSECKIIAKIDSVEFKV